MGNILDKKGDDSKTKPPSRETNLERNEIRGLSKSTPNLVPEGNPAPHHRKCVQIGNIKVSIIQGKMTEEKADVIVNSVASDLDLSMGKGSKALLESGGETIQKECNKSYPHGIHEDEVAVTNGGNLKCRKVYHVHLPKWEESSQAIESAMINCLKLADCFKVTSLAFPPFGSGYLGYPEDVLAESMLQSIVDFERAHHSTRIRSIVVVCHRTQNSVFSAFKDKARQLSGTISQGGSHTCKCGNISVVIQRGTITKQRADVMVVSTSKDLKLKNGLLSKSVLEAAGPDIQTACDNDYPSGVEYGEVAAVRGYKLPCRFVYFGCLPAWRSTFTSDNPKQILSEFITNCLEEADRHDIKHIAFPTLGTGALKYPPDVLAQTMKECIKDFDLTHSNIKLHHVYIVVYDKSRDCLPIENALLNEFNAARALKVNIPVATAPPIPVEASAPPESPTTGTPAYHMWMYRYNDKPPSYWSIFGPQKSLKEWNSQIGTDKYKITSVSKSVEKAVSKVVEDTWIPKYIGKGRDGVGLEDLGYSNIKVTKVERIENPELFEKYMNARGKLFHKSGTLEYSFPQLQNIPIGNKKRKIHTSSVMDKNVFTDIYPEINEHYLFHGTKQERIPTIAAQGFDLRLKDKAMFGAAIYAAESSTKSDQYADPKNERDKSNPKMMILLRMALGEIFVTEQEKAFARPPCKTCQDDKCSDASHNLHGLGFYDSIVVDGKWNFREFAAYSAAQCYPEYVITYKRI